MRLGTLLFIGLLMMLDKSPVLGQTGVDTLGLTGTLADTVVAKRLLTEMHNLINNQKLAEPERMGKIVDSILTYSQIENSGLNGRLFYQFGLIEYNKRNYDLAIDYFNKSLPMCIKEKGEWHAQIGDILHNLGLALYKKGKNQEAILSYQKSLDIRIKALGPEATDVAWSYNNLGNVFHDMGDYQSAIVNHQRAGAIFLKNLGENSLELATSFNNIGNALRQIGEYDEAIDYQIKCLIIRKDILDKNDFEIASIHNNLGTSYYAIGDYRESLQNREKAMTIALATLSTNHPDMAAFYINLGISYNIIGEYDKAIDYTQRGAETIVKNFGSDHKHMSLIYNNLGIYYTEKGDHVKAIEYLLKSMDIIQTKLGSDHPNLGSIFNGLGNAYDKIGNYKMAIEYHERALAIRTKNFGFEHPEVATSYTNLGTSHLDIGDYNKAIDCYTRASEICKKHFGVINSEISNVYSNLGNAYYLKSDFHKSISYYKLAFDATGFIEGSFEKVNSLKRLFRSLVGLSRLNYAYYHYYSENQAVNDAYYYIIIALNALNYQDNQLTQESKSFHRSQNYPIYEQAISVSLLKADVDKNDTLRHNTFTYAEKSKAALLQAQIKAADALAFAGIPDSLLEQEHKLRIDISWREKQHQSLLDKGLTETDTNVLRISGIVFGLKQQYEALKKRFETEYPDYYRLKYDLSTVSLAYVQDTLLQKDQALLEYFTGDSSIFLFVVRPDTFLVQEVKRDFPLEDWIDSLRYGIYGFYAADKTLQSEALKADAKRNYLEYAPKLYQKLIAPVAALLPEKVILVPDGPLGYIPFDALLTAEPEDRNDFKSYPYLLQKHQFSYTYSATLLREMRDKKHRREPQYDFAAFAPFYNGDTTLLAGMYSYDELMRKDLQPLTFSGPEVAAAAKLMKGETVAGAAATEERFTATAGNYRILHLATHGRADNRVGDYAFLAFTEIKDSVENELLYVKDLYNLQLNADLVVLSACETGIGKLQRGEGIISLARAFAYAGAKSIVTSLWSINDKSTSELMRFFYRELRRGKDKDEALRLARLRFLKESSVKNSHPFFWAAFVPLGDMRPVK